MKLERKELPLDLRASDDSGEIEGYGSVFGVTDGHGDIVEKGAFAASLAERAQAGDMLPMLWQHNAADIRGVWTSATEDDHGLALKGKLVSETVAGRDAVAFLRAGAIRGLSIGYRTKVDEYDRDTGIRTIKEAELWEVSLVTFPANRAAAVTAIKNIDEIDGMSMTDIEQHMRKAWDAPRDEAKRVINRLKALIGEREAGRAEAAETRAGLETLIRRLS